MERVFEHSEKESFPQACQFLARNESMNKDEAERLARAIRMVHMDWIKVNQVVHNSATGQYEVQCAYQREDQGQTLSRGSWTMLNIKSPRKSDRDTDTTL